MSSAKSKLGHNPLAGRGVGALFPATEPSTAESMPAAGVAYEATSKPHRTRPSRGIKTVSHLVNKVTQPSDENADFVRHTFYLTEAQGQKVKLYALIHGMQISGVIRMLVDNHLKIQP